MTDEIEQLLKNLKLGRMRSIYDEQLRAAEKQQVSYSAFIAALLRAQWAAFFDDWDLLICPVATSPAFEHAHEGAVAQWLDPAGRSIAPGQLPVHALRPQPRCGGHCALGPLLQQQV